MPHPIDIKDILSKNPLIDIDQIETLQELAKELRRFQKLRQRDYLVLPFSGKRARITDDLDSDPRATRLCDLKK
jgi:hypothetical protein